MEQREDLWAFLKIVVLKESAAWAGGSQDPCRKLTESNYFHNYTKTLFALFSVLTLTLLLQKAIMVKLGASKHKLRQWAPTATSHCILHILAFKVFKKKKSQFLFMSLMKQQKLLIFKNLYPACPSFCVPCSKIEVCIKHFCCIPKHCWCVEEKRLYCLLLHTESSHFFHETFFNW